MESNPNLMYVRSKSGTQNSTAPPHMPVQPLLQPPGELPAGHGHGGFRGRGGHGGHADGGGFHAAAEWRGGNRGGGRGSWPRNSRGGGRGHGDGGGRGYGDGGGRGYGDGGGRGYGDGGVRGYGDGGGRGYGDGGGRGNGDGGGRGYGDGGGRGYGDGGGRGYGDGGGRGYGDGGGRGYGDGGGRGYGDGGSRGHGDGGGRGYGDGGDRGYVDGGGRGYGDGGGRGYRDGGGRGYRDGGGRGHGDGGGGPLRGRRVESVENISSTANSDQDQSGRTRGAAAVAADRGHPHRQGRGGPGHPERQQSQPSRNAGGRKAAFRHGYVISLQENGSGFVTYEDDPAASTGPGVFFGALLVKQLRIRIGDRLCYRVELSENGKERAQDLSLAPVSGQQAMPNEQFLSATIIGEKEGEKSGDVFYLARSPGSCGELRFLGFKAQFGSWKPQRGDQVTLMMNVKDGKRKPFDVRLERPSSRNAADILAFIRSLPDRKSDEQLQELLSVPAAWAIVGQWPELSAASLLPVLAFFVRASIAASVYQKGSLALSILSLMDRRNFRTDGGPFNELFRTAVGPATCPKETLLTLTSFCELVVRLVPDRCYLTMQVCEAFYSAHMGIGSVFRLSKIMCRSLAAVLSCDLLWHELPVTLRKEELLDSSDSVHLLPVVRTHRSYESAEQYLDTNLRLLRADCFEKLKSGLRQFAKNSLNPRDMAIYWQVELRGVDVTQRDLSLLLRVRPFNRHVRSWESSPLLMFGNLLCLSFDETFTDFAWVTVSGRDSGLLDKFGFVFVEVCGELGTACDASLLRRLRASAGAMWLAESPTYFQAYRHVLTSLQSLHGQPMPLERALVTCQFDWMDGHGSDAVPPASLDASQTDAFKRCLQRNLGIVNGPPGSGKTHFAAHLVSALAGSGSGPVLLVARQHDSLERCVAKLKLLGDSKLNIRQIDPSVWLNQDAGEELLLHQARKSISYYLGTLFDLENVEFNEQFLEAYWSKEVKEHFTDGMEISLCDAIAAWVPTEDKLRAIRNDLLRLGATGSASSARTAKEASQEDWEENAPERYGPHGDGRRKFLDMNLQIRFASPSNCMRLDRRLAPLILAKWQALQHRPNLWDMKEEERFLYMQGCLLNHTDMRWSSREAEILDMHLGDYGRYQNASRQINIRKEMEACHGADVVAMTITAASISHGLLKVLRPSRVVVEEAAEIMEPTLLGCLGNWTERLYLIGDVKQQRPDVANNDLAKLCHLDVSMMERLINSGFPHDCLKFQNRMHPDISKYLKLDVYPDLKDNLAVVSALNVPAFMPKAVRFWDVRDSTEEGDRSYTNLGEAQLIVQLAQVYLKFGYKPSQLTLLTPYQGQVGLIRKLMRKALKSSKQAVTESPATVAKTPTEFIKVQVIDMYRGDENDVVLVSLVRSEKPGFLASLNCRCIAQSRSRSALVFIGRAQLLRDCAEWKPLIEALENDGALSCEFAAVCKLHGTQAAWRSAADLKEPGFCFEKCLQPMPCGEHRCIIPCHPMHTHEKCLEIKFVRYPCGHTEQIPCSDACMQTTCKRQCERLLSCGHKCPLSCAEPCDPKYCTVIAEAELPCGHVVSKTCNQPNPICSKMIQRKLGCGHSRDILCIANRPNTVSGMKCTEPCSKTLSCGHPCALQCHEVCSSVSCPMNVSKSCSSCGQAFTSKCGDGKSLCDRVMTIAMPNCGHKRVVKCSLRQQEMLKQCEQTCGKALDCDHQCSFPCGVIPCPPCELSIVRPGCNHKASCWERQTDCMVDVTPLYRCHHSEFMKCGAATRRVDDQYCSKCWPQAIQMRKAQLMANTANSSTTIRRTQLTEHSEDTSVEYFKVHDRVMRYIKSEHNISVQIQSIERIENPVLDKRLYDAYEQLLKKDCSPELFFHGTRSDIAEAIIREGFKVGSSGMYGAGIYFATDTTKSAQYCRETGTRSLLLCEVLLGRTMVCDSPQNHLSLQVVRVAGYDSVFAKRGTKNTKGVMNDEYIVYRPEQAAPRFLIKFT